MSGRGRIVTEVLAPHSLLRELWQASDNLRKGTGTNAVQIAEALLPILKLGSTESGRD